MTAYKITPTKTSGIYSITKDGKVYGAALVKMLRFHSWAITFVSEASTWDRSHNVIREELDITKKPRVVEKTWCDCKTNWEGEKCLHAQVLEAHLGRELTGLQIYGYTMKNGAIAAM